MIAIWKRIIQKLNKRLVWIKKGFTIGRKRKVIRKRNRDAVLEYFGKDVLNGKKLSKKEIADAAAKKVADKASADAKLKALGLTDDEIEAFRN